MKVEDIQIGDWVQNPRGAPYQVLAIHFYKINGDGDGYYGIHLKNKGAEARLEIYDLNPIPLTQEILEKNGFTYKDAVHNTYRGVWVYNAGNRNNVYVQFTDKVAIEIHNEINKKDNNGRADLASFCRDWCEVLFVHEFQRALRCVGLYELANSIKL